MKLSLTIQTPEVKRSVPVSLLTGSFEEKIAKAARMGADGVELMSAYPEELNAGEISALLVEQGLQVAAVASGALAFTLGITLLNADPDISKSAIQRLYCLIDFAVQTNAPVVTVGSFRGRLANLPGVDGRAVLASILREAAEYAHSRQVRLALESLNRYETDIITNVEQGLEFIAQVDRPALGLLLDTYHINIEESSWTEPFRRAMAAGKLFHVHLGDNNRLPPGRGLIDFSSIVSTLDQIGYTGYLSAELLGQPDPDTAAEQTIAYMRSLQPDH